MTINEPGYYTIANQGEVDPRTRLCAAPFRLQVFRLDESGSMTPVRAEAIPAGAIVKHLDIPVSLR